MQLVINTEVQRAVPYPDSRGPDIRATASGMHLGALHAGLCSLQGPLSYIKMRAAAMRFIL